MDHFATNGRRWPTPLVIKWHLKHVTSTGQDTAVSNRAHRTVNINCVGGLTQTVTALVCCHKKRVAQFYVYTSRCACISSLIMQLLHMHCCTCIQRSLLKRVLVCPKNNFQNSFCLPTSRTVYVLVSCWRCNSLPTTTGTSQLAKHTWRRVYEYTSSRALYTHHGTAFKNHLLDSAAS